MEKGVHCQRGRRAERKVIGIMVVLGWGVENGNHLYRFVFEVAEGGRAKIDCDRIKAEEQVIIVGVGEEGGEL